MPKWQAGLVTSILQQVVLRGTGTGAYLGRPCAGKTGTTTDYKDAWFCGYTPDLVAAVWVGYVDRPRPLFVRGVKVAGGTFPATIWQRFMAGALAGTPVRAFPDYEAPPVKKAIICYAHGRPGDEVVPRTSEGLLLQGCAARANVPVPQARTCGDCRTCGACRSTRPRRRCEA